jgi:hypothetical protein
VTEASTALDAARMRQAESSARRSAASCSANRG